MRPSVRLVVGTAVVSVAVGTSAALAAPWKVVGAGSASGDYAIAVATAKTRSPSAVGLRLGATPNRQVTATWTLVCSEGTRVASTSGRFAAATPALRVLRLPMARPDTCIASGSVASLGRGRVTIEIVTR